MKKLLTAVLSTMSFSPVFVFVHALFPLQTRMASASEIEVKEIHVSTSQELQQAIHSARPGHTILLAPGDYQGEMGFRNIKGTADAPIVIAGAFEDDPPVIRGGGTGVQFSSPSHLVLRDLVFDGATLNGINIDDGENPDAPARHIVLKNLRIQNIGTTGNDDAIKLSRVNDFVIENCSIEGWGQEGQAVDLTGCQRGRISDCHFQGLGKSKVGLQVKGGSKYILIERTHFLGMTDRAAQLGGVTGKHFFRAGTNNFEAGNIVLEDCIIVGSESPINFVGTYRATVRRNVIYRPTGWVIRILQENDSPEFVPCQFGVFEENVVVWESGDLIAFVNVGKGTSPETFRFRSNYWYCLDQPAKSYPRGLPVEEEDGVYGIDPHLINPESGDFRPSLTREQLRAAYVQTQQTRNRILRWTLGGVLLALVVGGLTVRLTNWKLTWFTKWFGFQMPSSLLLQIRPMPPPTAAHFRVFLGLSCFVITLASLLPWHFSEWNFDQAVSQLNQHPWGVDPYRKVEWLGNCLLFIPIGFLGAGSMAIDRFRTLSRWAGLLLVLVSGVFFSAFLEIIQFAHDSAVSSRNDIFAQVAGLCVGVGVWVLIGQFSVNLVRTHTRKWRPRQPVDWLLDGYLVGLLIYSAWPLNLTLHPVELYHRFNSGFVRLAPFAGGFSLFQFLASAAIFLPIGAWGTIVGTNTESPLRPVNLSSLLGIGVVLLAEGIQMFVPSRVFDTTAIFAGSIGVVLGAWLMHHLIGRLMLWSPLPTNRPAVKTARRIASSTVFVVWVSVLYFAWQYL